jgi:hypothetical protein
MRSQVSVQTEELSMVFSQLENAHRNKKEYKFETWVLFDDLVKALLGLERRYLQC